MELILYNSSIKSKFLNYKTELFLAILVIIHAVYFTVASFFRFDNFYTGKFDLGNMDQTVWNTINGRIFQFTDPNGTETVSRLAFHADFILILLSPLYFIWESPKILLLIQSATVAAGAIFVYLIANKYLKNKTYSLFISVAYLINPSLNYSVLYDFHPVVLATTFLLGAFYFLKTKRVYLFLLFLFLAAITKENVWIISALFGLYILYTKRLKLLGLSIFIVSILSFYYLIWHAIPQASQGQHFALEYYSEYGSSPGEIIKNTLFSPNKIIPIISEGARFEYLNQLLLPLGYLIVSPYFLFIVPELAINLLSSNPNLYQIYYQYTALLTPFLFISLIWILFFLKRKFPRIKIQFLIAVVIFSSLYSARTLGPLPGSLKPNTQMFTEPLFNRSVVDAYLSRISSEYSVSASNNLGAKLSQRENLYVIPYGTSNADFIAILLRRGPDDLSERAEREVLERVRRDSNYIEVFKNGGFTLFQRVDLGKVLSSHTYLQNNR